MQIIDALRRANSAHEVYFLLTNYVETLQFYDTSQRLPAGVASLPVRGASDVELRYTSLQETKLCGLARSHCDTNGAVVNEAVDVFYEALIRLRVLEQTAHAWANFNDAQSAIQRVT